MILLDTSGLFAALDRDYRGGQQVREIISQDERRLLSPFVAAELDYLISDRIGANVARGFLHDVAAGSYDMAPFGNADVTSALEVVDAYAGLNIGLTDASIAVLSSRYDCLNLVTLDERHFRVILGSRGRPFRILPADA